MVSEAVRRQINGILEQGELDAKIQAELYPCLYSLIVAMLRERTLNEFGDEDSAELTKRFYGNRIREVSDYVGGLEESIRTPISASFIQQQAIKIAKGMTEYIEDADREYIPRFTAYGGMSSGTGTEIRAPPDSYIYQKVLLKAANAVLGKLEKWLQNQDYLLQSDGPDT